MSDEWFTVEKLDEQTYAICENKHYEETRCYLLCGAEKAALIDTGLGVSNIKAVIDSLTDLPVFVVTTHVHWDHIGGHGLFANIAVHEAEEKWLDGEFPLPTSVVKANLTRENCVFSSDFDIGSYSVFQGKANTILRDGDCFDLGNRLLKVIHTPGHSPGHCCFYEPYSKYLYTGDLVYKGRLYANYPSTDPYCFLESIKKIGKLRVNRVLPGHHQMDIQPSLIGDIEDALIQIQIAGELHHGSGMHSYSDFQIEL